MDRQQIPWVTLSIVALAAVLTMALPGYGERLQYVRGGAWWSVLTSQFVHWNARMTLLDLGLVLMAGIWIERRFRLAVVVSFVTSVLLCALAIHLSHYMSVYRGSSGVAISLLTLVLLDLASRGNPPRIRIVAVLVLVLTVGKIAWEWRTGQALAVGPLPPGIRVASGVHLAGMLSGIVAFTVVGNLPRLK
jgi:membrane associated rhomboid family serine protease